jgi:hypothetical protein
MLRDAAQSFAVERAMNAVAQELCSEYTKHRDQTAKVTLPRRARARACFCAGILRG